MCRGIIFIFGFVFTIGIKVARAQTESSFLNTLFDSTKSDVTLSIACFTGFSEGSIENCNKSKPDNWAQSIIHETKLKCHARFQSKACQNFIKTDSKFLVDDDMCTEKDLCLGRSFMPLSIADLTKKCFEGGVLSAGEQLDSVMASLKQESTKKIINDPKKMSEIKLILEKELITQGRSKNEIDRTLKNMPPIQIYFEYEKIKQYSKSMARINTKTPSLYERANDSRISNTPFEGDPYRDIDVKIDWVKLQDRMQKVTWSDFIALLAKMKNSEFLENRKLELSCLSSQKYLQLTCWRLAYFISPATVVALASKGIKGAKFVALSSEKSGDISRVKTIKNSIDNKAPPELKMSDGAPGSNPASVAEGSTEIRNTEGRVPGSNFRSIQFKERITGSHYLPSGAGNVVAVPGLPKNMIVKDFFNPTTGERTRILYTTAKNKKGQTITVTRELPIDRLTGALDTNFENSYEFAKGFVKGRNGAASLITIDIDNVKKVSQTFTFGKKLPDDELRKMSWRIGDRYIKTVYNEINNLVKDKGFIVRSGGDEFQIYLTITDPVELSKLATNIRKAVRGPNVQSIFSTEMKARVAALKEKIKNLPEASPEREQLINAFRAESTPLAVPDISMGHIIINDVTLEDAIEMAEELIQNPNKIAKKKRAGLDTSKYDQSPPPDPKDVQPSHLHKIIDENPSLVGIKNNSSIPNDGLVPPTLNAPSDLIGDPPDFRYGPNTIRTMEDESGHSSKWVKTYFDGADGKRDFIARELHKNRKTGVLDLRDPRLSDKFRDFVEASKVKGRRMLWIDTSNIGTLNYLPGAMKNGDAVLKAFGRVLSSRQGDQILPANLTGTKFLVAVEPMEDTAFNKFKQDLMKDLAAQPEVKEVYDKMIKAFKEKISKPGTAVQPQSTQDLEKILERIRKEQNEPARFLDKEISEQDTFQGVKEFFDQMDLATKPK